MHQKLKRIEVSSNPLKKYRAVFVNKETGKTTHTDFGSAGMDDYTKTHDEAQKKRYRTRHAKDLETGDPTRAGFLSYYLLWAEPTLAEAVRKYRKRFGL